MTTTNETPGQSAGSGGRGNLLRWASDTLAVDLQSIKQVQNGAIFCQLFHALHPDAIDLAQVNFAAQTEYECLANYRLLQRAHREMTRSKLADWWKIVSDEDRAWELLSAMSRAVEESGVLARYCPLEAKAGSKGGKLPAPLEPHMIQAPLMPAAGLPGKISSGANAKQGSHISTPRAPTGYPAQLPSPTRNLAGEKSGGGAEQAGSCEAAACPSTPEQPGSQHVKSHDLKSDSKEGSTPAEQTRHAPKTSTPHGKGSFWLPWMPKASSKIAPPDDKASELEEHAQQKDEDVPRSNATEQPDRAVSSELIQRSETPSITARLAAPKPLELVDSEGCETSKPRPGWKYVWPVFPAKGPKRTCEEGKQATESATTATEAPAEPAQGTAIVAAPNASPDKNSTKAAEERQLPSTGKWLFSAGPGIQGAAGGTSQSGQKNDESIAPAVPKGLGGSMLSQRRSKTGLKASAAPVVVHQEAATSTSEPANAPISRKQYSGINWQWPCKPLDTDELDPDEPLPLEAPKPRSSPRIMVIEVGPQGIKTEERSTLPVLKPPTADASTQTDLREQDNAPKTIAVSQGRIVAPPEEADEEAAAPAGSEIVDSEPSNAEASQASPPPETKTSSWFSWLTRSSAGALPPTSPEDASLAHQKSHEVQEEPLPDSIHTAQSETPEKSTHSMLPRVSEEEVEKYETGGAFQSSGQHSTQESPARSAGAPATPDKLEGAVHSQSPETPYQRSPESDTAGPSNATLLQTSTASQTPDESHAGSCLEGRGSFSAPKAAAYGNSVTEPTRMTSGEEGMEKVERDSMTGMAHKSSQTHSGESSAAGCLMTAPEPTNTPPELPELPPNEFQRQADGQEGFDVLPSNLTNDAADWAGTDSSATNTPRLVQKIVRGPHKPTAFPRELDTREEPAPVQPEQDLWRRQGRQSPLAKSVKPELRAVGIGDFWERQNSLPPEPLTSNEASKAASSTAPVVQQAGEEGKNRSASDVAAAFGFWKKREERPQPNSASGGSVKTPRGNIQTTAKHRRSQSTATALQSDPNPFLNDRLKTSPDDLRSSRQNSATSDSGLPADRSAKEGLDVEEGAPDLPPVASLSELPFADAKSACDQTEASFTSLVNNSSRPASPTNKSVTAPEQPLPTAAAQNQKPEASRTGTRGTSSSGGDAASKSKAVLGAPNRKQPVSEAASPHSTAKGFWQRRVEDSKEQQPQSCFAASGIQKSAPAAKGFWARMVDGKRETPAEDPAGGSTDLARSPVSPKGQSNWAKSFVAAKEEAKARKEASAGSLHEAELDSRSPSLPAPEQSSNADQMMGNTGINSKLDAIRERYSNGSVKHPQERAHATKTRQGGQSQMPNQESKPTDPVFTFRRPNRRSKVTASHFHDLELNGHSSTSASDRYSTDSRGANASHQPVFNQAVSNSPGSERGQSPNSQAAGQTSLSLPKELKAETRAPSEDLEPQSSTPPSASPKTQYTTKSALKHALLKQLSSGREATANAATRADQGLETAHSPTSASEAHDVTPSRLSGDKLDEENQRRFSESSSSMMSASPGRQGLVYSTSGALKAALLKQLSGSDLPPSPHQSETSAVQDQERSERPGLAQSFASGSAGDLLPPQRSYSQPPDLDAEPNWKTVDDYTAVVARRRFSAARQKEPIEAVASMSRQSAPATTSSGIGRHETASRLKDALVQNAGSEQTHAAQAEKSKTGIGRYATASSLKNALLRHSGSNASHEELSAKDGTAAGSNPSTDADPKKAKDKASSDPIRAAMSRAMQRRSSIRKGTAARSTSADQRLQTKTPFKENRPEDPKAAHSIANGFQNAPKANGLSPATSAESAKPTSEKPAPEQNGSSLRHRYAPLGAEKLTVRIVEPHQHEVEIFPEANERQKSHMPGINMPGLKRASASVASGMKKSVKSKLWAFGKGKAAAKQPGTRV